MEPSQGAALSLGAAAVGLTLYNRGVFQGAYDALRGAPATPLVSDNGGVSPSGPNGTGSWAGQVIPGGGDALSQAEAVVTARRPQSDWLNWCLQWTDDVAASLGMPTSRGPGGRASSAANACAQQHLNSGLAPRGRRVCFSGGTDGHIGVSNGNDSYMSAGLPGGVQSQPYLHNPKYIGWY